MNPVKLGVRLIKSAGARRVCGYRSFISKFEVSGVGLIYQLGRVVPNLSGAWIVHCRLAIADCRVIYCRNLHKD